MISKALVVNLNVNRYSDLTHNNAFKQKGNKPMSHGVHAYLWIICTANQDALSSAYYEFMQREKTNQIYIYI